MRAENLFAAMVALSLSSWVDAANYSSAAEAKSALQRAEQQAGAAKSQRESLGNQIEALMREISRLNGQGPDVREIDTEIQSLLSEIGSLTFQKNSALAELRQGMFCDGCQKTCTYLFAHGEPCPHPGRSLRPATLEELAAKAREYDDQIAPLQERREQLSQTREARVREFRAQIDEKQRELAELRRRATDLNAQISRTNAEKMQARSQVTLMEQKEALEAAQKRMSERQGLKAQAEKERYEAQIAWRQAEDAQRMLTAANLTNDGQRNEPNETKPQPNSESDAEARRLEEAAQAARERASKAADRALELEQRARDLQPASPADAPLERVAESIEAIDAAQEVRSRSVNNPGEASASAQLLSLTATKTAGVDVGLAIDQFSNLLREAQDKTRISLANGKKVLRTAVERAIRSKMEEAERGIRNDLFGLGATTRLDGVEGPTPDSVLRGAVNDAFTDASSIALSDVNKRSAVAQTLTDSALERFSGWCSGQIRDRIISVYNEIDFGIADTSNSSYAFERARDAFYKAISRGKLLMETGGTSISGLRKYLGGVRDSFFNYFDLALDHIEESTNPDASAP